MLRHRTTAFVWGCLLWVAPACTRSAEPPPAPRESSDARVRALADAFLEGFFDRNPDAVTIGQFHDRVLEDGAVPVSFLREKIRSWEHTT